MTPSPHWGCCPRCPPERTAMPIAPRCSGAVSDVWAPVVRGSAGAHAEAKEVAGIATRGRRCGDDAGGVGKRTLFGAVHGGGADPDRSRGARVLVPRGGMAMAGSGV